MSLFYLCLIYVSSLPILIEFLKFCPPPPPPALVLTPHLLNLSPYMFPPFLHMFPHVSLIVSQFLRIFPMFPMVYLPVFYFRSQAQLWQQLTHLACMVLLIASVIILVMLHYSSPMQDENFIKILAKYQIKILLAIRKHMKVGNMILKKVYFPKSNKISKQVSIYISVFKLSKEKMFNYNTV